MKKTLLATLSIILVAVMALALVACGDKTDSNASVSKVNPADPKTDVGTYKSRVDANPMPDMVSWEGINQFKTTTEIAKLYETDAAAAIAEARQLSVDFFRYCKYAQWTPSDQWDFTHHDDGRSPDTLHAGVTYGGLPYVGLAYSAIYRLMDFIDPATGVVDIYKAGGKNHELQKMFGNQCAQGAYQGWSRFINSAKYGGTPSMVESKGFYKIGNYIYDRHSQGWNKNYGTDECCTENGKEVLFESYALMDVGDGIVNFTTAGHVVMIATKPEVIRDETTGKIDGTKSFVTVIDQTPQWSKKNDSAGVPYDYQSNVDAKWTFEKLFEGNYVPFTYAEWLGNNKIETPSVRCLHTGDTITVEQLFNTWVKCNYHIYDIYCSIYNADGVEVAKVATHNKSSSTYELKFESTGMQSVIWGNLETLDPAKYEYTAKIYAQLATGERPTLWEGKLAPTPAEPK